MVRLGQTVSFFKIMILLGFSIFFTLSQVKHEFQNQSDPKYQG